ncbi:fimbrial protein [Enterobacter hormaechei]|uniref:fimbrial protein n=1 Tax=Enterobacter hormaechei TaxID=158836 RepID=UPI0021618C6D|nr:fimbrial protein [Enterobacter hormaechei]
MLKRKWLASAFMMMLPWLSYADASLTLTGNVVASPCTVDTDTVNKTVDLGTLQRRDLQTAGEGGEWRTSTCCSPIVRPERPK